MGRGEKGELRFLRTGGCQGNHAISVWGSPFWQDSIQRKVFHSAFVHPPLHLFLKYSRPINIQVEESFLSPLIGTKMYLNKCLL